MILATPPPDTIRVHETREPWELAELLRQGWCLLRVGHASTLNAPLFVLGRRAAGTNAIPKAASQAEAAAEVEKARWMGVRAHSWRIRLHRAWRALSGASSLRAKRR